MKQLNECDLFYSKFFKIKKFVKKIYFKINFLILNVFFKKEVKIEMKLFI